MAKLIIDVREPHEYAGSHVAGAINIPLNEIARGSAKLDEVELDTEIVLYCRSGGRSGMALAALKEQGYTNLTNGINQAVVENNHL